MKTQQAHSAMRQICRTGVAGLVLATVTACGGTGDTRPLETEDLTRQPTVTPISIDGAVDGTGLGPGSLASRAPIERVIFFDYDQSELRPEFVEIVTQHGRFLAQNGEGRVRLEGHTDERGTREYNIALGEARAKTIARMLQLQGVNSVQLRTLSFGEELPVDEAHNNDAWAKNRRVNIIYEESAIQN